MNEPYKISFALILAVVFLLPLFFLSSLVLPLSISKAALLSVGGTIVSLAFIYETIRLGRLYLPSTYLLWSVVLVPAVYLASALTGLAPKLSLFGYNLEVGTFGSVLVLFVFMGIVSMVFVDTLRIIKLYGVLLLSLSLVLIFGLAKVLSHGSWFEFGVFSGVMGNSIGAWTDYAICFGFLTLVSLFAVAMLPLSKMHRNLMNAVIALSVFLLMVINFSNAWQLVLGTSLVALVYFMTVERRIAHADSGSYKLLSLKLAPLVIVFFVSLLFVINPTLSSTKGPLGDYISNSFGVRSVDVRPSLSSTLGVAGSTLKTHALLGSGPNTFAEDWLMYKPAAINLTTFWNTAFPYGFGFLPTQIATTGLLGTFLWLLFLGFFLVLGIRALVKNSQVKSERFLLVSSFVGSMFLWVAATVYTPSAVILALAFILTGVFIASSRVVNLIPSREIVFSRHPLLNFGSMLVAILLVIGTVGFAFTSYKKIASAFHFQKALSAVSIPDSSVDSIEAELGKASDLGPMDIYFSALAQLEFARAQSVLANATGTPEQARTAFQTAISRSIAGAQAATQAYPGNYQNWITLGSIYAALVPAPLSVPGAYEGAKLAYTEAVKLDPLSPEISLLEARLELDHGNSSTARAYINESIQKKEDYAEAYFLLTQLEAAENHINEAIKSAETAALLSPNNAGIFFELGLLKYANQNYKGSAENLTKALTILPDYANAKYYLGLSLDQLGRRSEAILLFEDLAKRNADNQNVAQILANLRADHDAFYQSINTAKPSLRTTPPIPTTSAPRQ